MSRWCNLYNCFCNEVDEIIEETFCDGDCRNCEDSEELN